MKRLLCLISILSISNAFAWGPTGHRVVGEVAEKYLKKKVLKKITKILDGDTLARVSNWPDKIKSEPETYKHTYRWHYTDWPNEAVTYKAEGNNGSLITAIEDNIKVIADKNKTKAEKRFAISFIVHLIGDLHQPLHVGNGLDRGGNNCKVLFHKELVSLHRLWDVSLIAKTKLTYTELAKFIDTPKKGEIKAHQASTLLDWANESKALREELYPAEITPSTGLQKNYCMRDLVLLETERPALSYGYSYKFMPIVEKRLFQAGVRLAKVLNDNLD
jgi:hypothetical protein